MRSKPKASSNTPFPVFRQQALDIMDLRCSSRESPKPCLETFRLNGLGNVLQTRCPSQAPRPICLRRNAFPADLQKRVRSTVIDCIMVPRHALESQLEPRPSELYHAAGPPISGKLAVATLAVARVQRLHLKRKPSRRDHCPTTTRFGQLMVAWSLRLGWRGLAADSHGAGAAVGRLG